MKKKLFKEFEEYLLNLKTPKDRFGLGFVSSAVEAFGFLEDSYGMQLSKVEPYLVYYHSDDLYVYVLHDFFSYEIVFRFGKTGNEKNKYSLREIYDVFKKCNFDDFYQSSDKDNIKKSLIDVANRFQKYLDLILDDKENVFNELARSSHCRSEKETAKYSKEAKIKNQALDAWKDRNFHEVSRLYSLVEPSLKPLELKRYNFVKRHLSNK